MASYKLFVAIFELLVGFDKYINKYFGGENDYNVKLRCKTSISLIVKKNFPIVY